jgi:hypothetical protein
MDGFFVNFEVVGLSVGLQLDDFLARFIDGTVVSELMSTGAIVGGIWVSCRCCCGCCRKCCW